MQDKKLPKKKKVQKEIYHHGKNKELTWGDIKDLELEDEDVIHSTWVEDDSFDYQGYWQASITRFIEETDAEFEKRIASNKSFRVELKHRRYETYLKLKKEFEKA